MESNFDKAINFAAVQLGISPDQLHNEQRSILSAFLSKKDVLVGLPTGFGKSFVFQAGPLAVDYLTKLSLYDEEALSLTLTLDGLDLSPGLHLPVQGAEAGINNNSDGPVPDVSPTPSISSIAIIISPLTSLTNDQVTFLTGKGHRALYFEEVGSSGEKLTALENGFYNYVFMSPEQLMSPKGFSLIKKPVYRKHLCGVFVDESHCIAKWGVGSAKMKAFRAFYGKRNQVRSNLSTDVPLVALTATASLSVRKLITEKLNLRNPVTVLRSPEKTNIRYSLLNIKKSQDMQSLCADLIGKLAREEEPIKRVIFFCRSHRHCREMYSAMTHEYPQLKSKIAMFHSTTEESVKEKVVDSFADEKGEVRMLFATIAFGMGIDVKGVYNIIHIGPPSDLDDYLQETGRSGRGGIQNYAILVNYSGSSGRFTTSESMKAYVKNKSLCRRKLILEPFGYVPAGDTNRPQHLCCDICAQKCLCGSYLCSDASQGRGSIEEMLCEQITHTRRESSERIASRTITEENVVHLREELLHFREAQLASPSDATCSKRIAGDDIASGFPLSTVDDLMENINSISSSSVIKQKFILLNPQHADKVMAIITKHTDPILDEPAAATMAGNSETTESSDGESTDGESTDDSISEYRHLRLSPASSDD